MANEDRERTVGLVAEGDFLQSQLLRQLNDMALEMGIKVKTAPLAEFKPPEEPDAVVVDMRRSLPASLRDLRRFEEQGWRGQVVVFRADELTSMNSARHLVVPGSAEQGTIVEAIKRVIS